MPNQVGLARTWPGHLSTSFFRGARRKTVPPATRDATGGEHAHPHHLPETTTPLRGSRISRRVFGLPSKSNMFMTVPATWSKEP